jgi:anaerobic magnesium-protoporphyrin IX monomethyl ester cyclase
LNIVLIRPPRVFKKFNKALKPAPPIGLALLASVLQNHGHCVKLIDGIVEDIENLRPFGDDLFINGLDDQILLDKIDHEVQIIGFSSMFTVDWIYLKDLINLVAEKFPKARIIAGGEHVTALPELCLEQCPKLFACVLGEGEETIVELVNAINNNSEVENINGIAFRDKSNKMVRTLKRQRLKDLDLIPIPNWDLLPVQTYFDKNISFGIGGKKTLPILATRGCPYTCTFCSSPDMWGIRYYMRSVTNVVDEIEHLVNRYGVENIDLYDLTAIINSKWIIAFSKELLERKLNITWQLPSGTRSEAITPEVVHHMKISGCTVITYAPESGSDRVLKEIHKKVNLKKMLKSISDSWKEGLFVKVNIIIGLPMETHSDIFKTMLFILKCSWAGAYDMGPNPFYPIPGTVLFTELEKAGKVDIRNRKYYVDLLDADNIWKGNFYNENISKPILRFYFIFYFLVFYFSNFIFFPKRLFETIRNVWAQKPQTRGQHVLVRIIEQSGFYDKK